MFHACSPPSIPQWRNGAWWQILSKTLSGDVFRVPATAYFLCLAGRPWHGVAVIVFSPARIEPLQHYSRELPEDHAVFRSNAPLWLETPARNADNKEHGYGRFQNRPSIRQDRQGNSPSIFARQSDRTAAIYGKSGRTRICAVSVAVSLAWPSGDSHDRRRRRCRISLLDLEAAVNHSNR